jgi:hypothetical protein
VTLQSVSDIIETGKHPGAAIARLCPLFTERLPIDNDGRGGNGLLRFDDAGYNAALLYKPPEKISGLGLSRILFRVYKADLHISPRCSFITYLTIIDADRFVIHSGFRPIVKENCPLRQLKQKTPAWLQHSADHP